MQAGTRVLPERSLIRQLIQISKISPVYNDIESLIRSRFSSMEGNTRKIIFGDLVSLLLPLEKLVPDIYAKWRPVVRDAVIYIGGSLSEERLIPKIVEQLMFPADHSLEKRIVAFISQMPSLQKLGQTVARNRNLNPEFRSELIKLENMICDVTADQIQIQIRNLLGPLINEYDVRLEQMLHAEASVSAVMRFTWKNPKVEGRDEGVFKVLKPYVRKFIKEELDLLQGLAVYLRNHSKEYFPAGVDLKGLIDDVVELMEREIDSVNEQANLESANRRYHNSSGIRVPVLIRELSCPGITAMTFENGVKVTDACHGNTLRRARISARIIEALVAIPLFTRDDEAVFHADPHAGNLFFNEETDKLVIYDWAMTERLDLDERRLMLLLMSGLMLRDEQMIYKTVIKLSRPGLSDSTCTRVKRQIREFISTLSPLTRPGFEQVLELVDNLVFTGINFSTPLLIFRKVLMTMNGLLHDMNMKLPLENVLARHFLDQYLRKFWVSEGNTLANRIPLKNTDIFSLYWSSQWLGVRIGMQTGRRLLTVY